MELTDDPRIIKKIRELLIFNVDKSEDLKNCRKSKTSLSILGIEFGSRSVNNIPDLELMIKRITKVQSEKNGEINLEVGENVFDEKSERF